MFRGILIFALFTIVSCDRNIKGRILNGTLAEAREIPYIASLRTAASPFTHIAGGALISDRWVLTSASALINLVPASISVVLGLIDSQQAVALPGIRLLVSNIRRHEQFNIPHLGANDIALVQLAAAAPCGGRYFGYISPIFIPSTREANPVDVVMSGWGAMSTNIGPGSRFLRTLRIRTISNEDCQSFYANDTNIQITFDVICTNNERGSGWCSTDIGGPLASANGLIGIASHNVPCGQGAPDVYTRVSSYRDWIRGITVNGRILNGNLAEAREIPYIASLRSAVSPFTHFAGGALIHF
ncbi:hypothetical protein PVAND_008342 [Polypedilum vanderplanki]|uniref:Peptidase S1 domain-containing protein n=1 Tax=Polypedilum vanderplanki TaxID=319348 RepID=A0A9J6C9W4_POLVA|nr:hypothetical protein PVAND_008342 [Polypedilum vanderplanki]